MSEEDLIEVAKSSGLFHCAKEYGVESDAFTISIKYFSKTLLEIAAKSFDERGKQNGEWVEGWYDPQEPGDILRSMAELVLV